MPETREHGLVSVKPTGSSVDGDSLVAEKHQAIVLIIDTPQPGQTLQSGSRLLVTGWAAATDSLQEIAVEISGIRQLAALGIYRPDLVAAFPTVPALASAGFSASIPLPSFEQQADCQLKVTARSLGGLERSEVVPIVLVPAVRSENPLEHQSDAQAESAMKLTVDQALVVRTGILRVSGWVVSYSRLQSVELYLDDESLGVAELGLKREDVGESWSNYPNALESGFAFKADVSRFEGQKNLVVRAHAAGGIRREIEIPLKLKRPDVSRETGETQRLVCDSAILTTDGQLLLEGWAVSSTGIEQIRVVFEDEILGMVECGLDRADVGNSFPTIAQARKSGFRFSGKADSARLKSEHVVRFEMCLVGGDAREFKVAVAPQNIAVVADALAAESAQSQTMLFIDDPILRDGSAVNDIQGSLSIIGWALARDGIENVEILLDGVRIGEAYYGMRREDISAAFPDWNSSLLSGFAFSLPSRALQTGQHALLVRAKSKSSALAEVSFNINVSQMGEQPGPWSLRQNIVGAEALVIERLIEKFEKRPQFTIVIRGQASAEAELVQTIGSLKLQLYDAWTIRISCSPNDEGLVRDIIFRRFPEIATRVAISPLAENIEKTATAHSKRTSAVSDRLDWFLFLEVGDKLSVDSLFEFAARINQNTQAEFIYSDDRRYEPGTRSIAAFFKPEWSPDLLLSSNYIGRAFCVRGNVLERCRISNPDQATDYDLVLRIGEKTQAVDHIQRVLAECPRRSFSNAKSEKKALTSAIKRRKMSVSVQAGRTPDTFRLRSLTKIDELVSIIIPTCAAGGLIETCLKTLREKSTYTNIEIVCIDNILDPDSKWKSWLRDNADVVVEITESFNWSRFNNLAAQEAAGSFLLFLNDDIEIIEPDWLETMLAIAQRPETGVVGPQLLYPDRKVQHAGLFLSGLGTARHSFRFLGEDDPSYFDLALTQRNVIGVTGACMLMRREVFDRVGGFEESHAVVNNDLDFCLKTHAAGLWNVFTPFATLFHHELASRAHIKDVHDTKSFNSQWEAVFAAGDPFFHPNLSRTHDSYQYEMEPSCSVFSGHPRYRHADVKRILAVKIDHIGDFITAFPAFQRIKQRFPNAELSVLASPAARTLFALEPSIDRLIPFEFFHARSGLGQKDVGADELEALQRELAQFDFDLAVDLRKHPDSRKLLQYSGAKLTAGFDSGNKFPWLDIVAQWEGDTKLVPKRQHVSDDLINLVDAIAAAGEHQRGVLKKSDDWSSRQIPIVTRLSRDGMYSRPIVCVHPASGTEMRQWPPTHFATLINMLIEQENVNVAIIGGPDELEIANEVLGRIKVLDRVTSLVGKLKLNDLPYFIESCALFVGNNSGPKHISAALGVPTLGIHSGVVDPNEWGPLGEIALAVKRDVSCAPCYSAKREDCHRDLICLSGLLPAHVFSACRRLLRAKHGVSIVADGVINQ